MIDQQSNEDFSVYYYMKNLFTPMNILVVDEFPVQNLVIPSVAVEADTISPTTFELGNSKRIYYRVFYIDYFAVNKTQRQQMGYTILRSLEETIPVYDFNGGFFPDANPTQIGCLEILDIEQQRILIDPELVSKLYYRGKITFTAYFNRV